MSKGKVVKHARACLDVVIPARGEETILPATLEAVLANGACLSLTVVLVLNGDRRDAMRKQAEAIAARFHAAGHDFRIVEITAPGKPSALNAGDAARTGDAVVYLDADAVLLPGTLCAIADALATHEPRLVGPPIHYARPANALLRGFAAIWKQLPAVSGDVIGAGCYGTNARGRQRWNSFPELAADDGFVRSRFQPHERVIADSGGMIFAFPEGRSLYRALRRWRLANRLLLKATGQHLGPGLVGNIRWALRHPLHWHSLPFYLLVRMASSFVRIERGGASDWLPERSNSVSPFRGEKPLRAHVIIVTYNSASDILACLDSIHSDYATLDCTVVDNASSDDTVARIRAARPGTRIACNRSNLGFGTAVNAAAGQADGADYIMLVNPDTVLRAGALDALLALALRFPSAGLYGGHMVDQDGRLDPTSCLADPGLWHAAAFGLGTSLFHGRPILDPDSLGGWKRSGIREVPVLTAGLLLVDADLWRNLSGFEEAFFLYGEDVDLCIRARALGARPMFSDACRYMHRGGRSSRSPGYRNIAILTGKATLYDLHVQSRFRGLAKAFLITGVALRATLERLTRPHSDIWRMAWARRRDWLGGWSRQSTSRDSPPAHSA